MVGIEPDGREGEVRFPCPVRQGRNLGRSKPDINLAFLEVQVDPVNGQALPLDIVAGLFGELINPFNVAATRLAAFIL